MVSWNPVIVEEAAVVPMSPLITVLIPELVIPAPPPKPPKGAAAPRGKAGAHASADPVVKLHISGLANGVLARSSAPIVIVTV